MAKHYNQGFGTGGELRVKARLEAMGYEVKHFGGNNGYDLLVNGAMRVEVKSATPTRASVRKIKTGKRAGEWHYRPDAQWHYNLRRHGKHLTADLVILLGFSADLDADPVCFIIPAKLFAPGQRMVRLSTSDKTKSKWVEGRERWDLVAPMLEIAANRPDLDQVLKGEVQDPINAIPF